MECVIQTILDRAPAVCSLNFNKVQFSVPLPHALPLLPSSLPPLLLLLLLLLLLYHQQSLAPSSGPTGCAASVQAAPLRLFHQ
jgi:hypothetical protein